MRKTSLDIIANWAQGKAILETSITGVAVDSRLVKKDDLFVCLVGEKVDGHLFAETAISNGASALLVNHQMDLDFPQIVVDDTLIALNKIATSYRNTLDLFVIGITGSNGKTSTKDMLHSILSLKGKTWATHSNQNTEIGTYLNLFNLDDSYDYGVFEFGLDKPGEVSNMVNLMKADGALLTSLAPAHMVNFKDIDHIADEKVKIFDSIQNPNLAYYQGDFDHYKSRIGRKFKSYGFDESNDFIVKDIKLGNFGVEFSVNNEFYSTNLMGSHQASNAAGVIALCLAMGIDEETIKEGLNNVELTGLRTEILQHKNSTLILDAYKSNPSSTLYALELMDAYTFEGPRYCVLSEMVELGFESDAAHRQVLDALKQSKVTKVYTLGDEFKKLSNFYDIEVFDDFESLDHQVQCLFEEKALILIKGSRSYALERLVRKDD
ncbi:UDP-N-acetylmuramoyl-tripeptide--D-alanyl-D-alanine ligase [Erysipelothrix urinaevulpis]|uniref:UDP-N-acetylmuramoyl-tripeptide--D-alanyl-D- alanine ligase n=1 Tax=Erysipelothrix urinaevulpis TaxID=2683717 RepID=UPI00135BDE6D|nr:UDP-N-acetylmuramoyl-tripeptide--D-alanyl-D-alanine ligase [Erysipelothrix urinaevulpis]